MASPTAIVAYQLGLILMALARWGKSGMKGSVEPSEVGGLCMEAFLSRNNIKLPTMVVRCTNSCCPISS